MGALVGQGQHQLEPGPPLHPCRGTSEGPQEGLYEGQRLLESLSKGGLTTGASGRAVRRVS